MHAVVFQIDFKPGWEGDLDAEVDQLIAFVTTMPGFVRGTWASDGAQGLSFILFETEAAARALADNARMPDEASGVLRSVTVLEVARDV